MSKKEFMEELEILLGELPKEEREDVLRYYESYFEDAGVAQEQIVMQELGSAGRVAAQILREFREEKAEGIYTEHGYQERENIKETPIRYEAKQEKTKQEQAKSYEKTQREATTDGSGIHSSRKKLSGSSLVLILILTILTFPIWITVLGGVFGTLFGLFVALIGVVIGFGAAGIACTIVGLVVLCVGIVKCLALPIVGAVFIAIALLVFGIGCLLLVATIGCVKLASWLIKMIWNLLQRLLHGGREAIA